MTSGNASVAAPLSLRPGQPYTNYGLDDPILRDLLGRTANDVPSVDAIEVFVQDPGVAEPGVLPRKHRVNRRTYSDLDSLSNLLGAEVPDEQTLRILTVNKLSGPVLQLLGTKYEMDYELWTNRFQSSDREWFAGPYLHRGAQKFIHFNLSCIEFCRATAATPQIFLENRKIGHTVRLLRFLDPKTQDSDATPTYPRVFILRRIAGHLRNDNNLWTFIFLTDPYLDISSANYVSDIPGRSLSPFSNWLSEYMNDESPPEMTDDLGRDGFGLIYKVLRDIKTSWKLLLNEMETFMETLAENYSDKELVESATWLHRRFITNLDYCTLQLLYHQRFVTYLTNSPSQNGLCLTPDVYKGDLLQEKDALGVVVQRLKDIRDRTTSILETVLSLQAAHQAQIATEMTALQRQDAAIAMQQTDAVKRLTFVNMVFLPPSLIAGVFGMNVVQNASNSWSLWSFLGVAAVLTIITLMIGKALSEFRPKISTDLSNIVTSKSKFQVFTQLKFGMPDVVRRLGTLISGRKRTQEKGSDLV